MIAEGRKWSYSKTLKETGAEIAYSVPARAKIERYQASLWRSIIGSRGPLLSPMDAKENRKRSMPMMKARFREVPKLFGANVEVNPDGTYKAGIKIPSGIAPGKYNVVAVTDKDIRSAPATFENRLTFPNLYLINAGTSVNILWPFLIVLVVCTFTTMWGAGGGFIINPLFVLIYPFPHAVVAGTVMPTVLFSQATGVYNYQRIRFVSWKTGLIVGLAMILGGFIGPKLTELITLEQFKFSFGIILIALAAIMLWQTTPGYLERSKKESVILKEFKRRAEEAAEARAAKKKGGQQ